MREIWIFVRAKFLFSAQRTLNFDLQLLRFIATCCRAFHVLPVVSVVLHCIHSRAFLLLSLIALFDFPLSRIHIKLPLSLPLYSTVDVIFFLTDKTKYSTKAQTKEKAFHFTPMIFSLSPKQRHLSFYCSTRLQP